MKPNHIRAICARQYGRKPSGPRRVLTPSERKEVWLKTRGICHVCGDSAGKRWQADHVVPHKLGGKRTIDNYLPICRECNRLRWSHRPKVIRLIIRMGVYAKNQIRHETPFGDAMIQLVLGRLGTNRRRRRPEPRGRAA